MTAVSKVTLNGTTLMDATSATATASEIIAPYTAMTADGVMTTGTGSGGGSDHWVRPSDFPDYSKVDFVDGESVAYLTYKPNLSNGEAVITIYQDTTTSTADVSIGTLNNGVYTELSTETATGKTVNYNKSLSNYDFDYVVIKISGARWFVLTDSRKGDIQPCLEIYAQMPGGPQNNIQPILRNNKLCRSVILMNTPVGVGGQRICGDANGLENFELRGTSSITSLYYAFANCHNLKYFYLNGSRATTVTNAFQNCYNLEYTDLETCNFNISSNDNINNIFENCRSLKSLNLTNWNVECNSCNSTFLSCTSLDTLNISNWRLAGQANSIFNGTHLMEIPAFIDNGITSLNGSFQNSYIYGTLDLSGFNIAYANNPYMVFVKKIILPSTITSIPANAFRDCGNMEEFHLESTTPPTLANANAFTTNIPNTSLIYVPYSADHSILSAYQSAANWSTLASRIVEESA